MSRRKLTSILAGAAVSVSTLAASPAPTPVAGPAPAFSAPEKVIRFDVSQQRLFRDNARVIVVCWHRQKGKDFTAAAKAVDSAMETGQDWFLVSLTQRQADATFAKCKKVFIAFREMIKKAKGIDVGEATDGPGWDYEEIDKAINHAFECKARELVLPNGARIVSLPGKDPDTLAGLTGNVIFTEFGLFPGGGYEHWRVVFPLSTRGFQVIVISTPRAKNTKFFELCSDKETYSVHFCDIVQSVEHEGFVLKDNKGQVCTLEQFKKLYGDEAGWQREYLCLFTGDMESLIKWAQLLTASEAADGRIFQFLHLKEGLGWDPTFFAIEGMSAEGRFEIGWDVARHANLSSVWVNHAIHGRPKELRALVVMSDCEFELQREVIIAAMNAGGRSRNVGAGDATGLGADSNETLSKRFRNRWEAVTFTTKTKSELASVGSTTYGDRGQLLPSTEDYKFIHTDVYALQKKEVGGQGEDKRILLTATENELMPASHCDIAYSNLLALRAGTRTPNAPLKTFSRKPGGL